MSCLQDGSKEFWLTSRVEFGSNITELYDHSIMSVWSLFFACFSDLPGLNGSCSSAKRLKWKILPTWLQISSQFTDTTVKFLAIVLEDIFRKQCLDNTLLNSAWVIADYYSAQIYCGHRSTEGTSPLVHAAPVNVAVVARVWLLDGSLLRNILKIRPSFVNIGGGGGAAAFALSCIRQHSVCLGRRATPLEKRCAKSFYSQFLLLW